jgi:hypothetical protein
MVHAACWAHARRQFFEAVQLNPRDPAASEMFDTVEVSPNGRRTIPVLLQIADIGVGTLAQNT